MTQKQHSQIIALGDRIPNIADDAWIAPGAVIVGHVSLGAQSSVWYNAVLRGDSAEIVIGERSNLQDGVAVHVDQNNPTVLGAGVSVGHNAVVHGATIGDDTLIGMNSTILSGAVIGSECLIAAGALVPQGKIIPDGSLVAGIPAKVVRELTVQEKHQIRQNATIYLQHSKDHREALFETDREMY